MNRNKFIKKSIQATLALAILTASSALTGALTMEQVYAVENPTVSIAVVQMKQKIVFPDVKVEWQKLPVAWAVDREVVQGYPDGTFKPDNQMTEAEWATMLVRYASNIDYDKLTPVQQKHWSQHLYNELAKYSLPFKGYNTDSIKNKPITRGDIAIIVAAKNGFNLTLEQAVEYMYENELSEGMGSVKDFKNYGANTYLTRAQATAFVQRLSTKPVTTFRGIPSQVAADEILGVKNPVYDGTKEVVKKEFHKVAETIAAKYGYKADTTSSTGTSIRDNDNKKLVGYGSSNGVTFSSYNDHIPMLLEMIQQIQKLDNATMKKVEDTLMQSIKDFNIKYVQIPGGRIQIQGSYNKDIMIMFLNW